MAYLCYSEDQAQDITRPKSFFNGAAFAVALDDDGNKVKLTQIFHSESGVEGWCSKFPSADQPIEVSKVRLVEDSNGRPYGQDKWSEWGYEG